MENRIGSVSVCLNLLLQIDFNLPAIWDSIIQPSIDPHKCTFVIIKSILIPFSKRVSSDILPNITTSTILNMCLVKMHHNYFFI